jgi:16S rRNA C967 or C1407 C5-methylase (RsmB/RsmF family)
MEKINRLWGMRCYLSGAMDKADDFGKGWRLEFTPFLQKLGVVVLDPCDKPIEGEFEIENRDFCNRLREEERYEELNQEVRLIRVVDLRMVDMADFLVVNVDNDVPSCGTWEEIALANRQKNPILIRCAQGKKNIPGWVWGMIPHQHIFGEWNDLKKYLLHVNSDEDVDTMKRWMFFDYSAMIPRVSVHIARENVVDLSKELGV